MAVNQLKTSLDYFKEFEYPRVGSVGLVVCTLEDNLSLIYRKLHKSNFDSIGYYRYSQKYEDLVITLISLFDGHRITIPDYQSGIISFISNPFIRELVIYPCKNYYRDDLTLELSRLKHFEMTELEKINNYQRIIRQAFNFTSFNPTAFNPISHPVSQRTHGTQSPKSNWSNSMGSLRDQNSPQSGQDHYPGEQIFNRIVSLITHQYIHFTNSIMFNPPIYHSHRLKNSQWNPTSLQTEKEFLSIFSDLVTQDSDFRASLLASWDENFDLRLWLSKALVTGYIPLNLQDPILKQRRTKRLTFSTPDSTTNQAQIFRKLTSHHRQTAKLVYSLYQELKDLTQAVKEKSKVLDLTQIFRLTRDLHEEFGLEGPSLEIENMTYPTTLFVGEEKMTFCSENEEEAQIKIISPYNCSLTDFTTTELETLSSYLINLQLADPRYNQISQKVTNEIINRYTTFLPQEEDNSSSPHSP